MSNVRRQPKQRMQVLSATDPTRRVQSRSSLSKFMKLSERTLVNLGAGAGIVLAAAIGELIFSPSWGYAACATAVAAAAFGLLALALKASRKRRPGAPTNTQLQ